MKSAPMIKSILHFSLAVLILLIPCFAFAEEPMPTPTDPASGTTEFEAGEIIIEFKEGIPQDSVQPLLLEPNHIVQIADTIAVESITVFAPRMSFPMIHVILVIMGSGTSPRSKPPPLGTSPLAVTR